MCLEENLVGIRETGEKRMPEGVRATMAAATKALTVYGVMDGVIKVGDTLPAFSLPNSTGNTISLADIQANGPTPGRLMVDKSSTVRAANIDPNYIVRPDPEKTLADLAALC